MRALATVVILKCQGELISLFERNHLSLVKEYTSQDGQALTQPSHTQWERAKEVEPQRTL